MVVSEDISPSQLTKGSKVFHENKCYTVITVKSCADLAHGRVYALELGILGEQVRISVIERAKLKGYQ